MAVKKAFGFVRNCVEKYTRHCARGAVHHFLLSGLYALCSPPAAGLGGRSGAELLLWLVLLGACYAQRMKAHVTFTLLYDKLSIKGKAVVAMLGDIIIAFTAFCNILPSLLTFWVWRRAIR